MSKNRPLRNALPSFQAKRELDIDWAVNEVSKRLVQRKKPKPKATVPVTPEKAQELAEVREALKLPPQKQADGGIMASGGLVTPIPLQYDASKIQADTFDTNTLHVSGWAASTPVPMRVENGKFQVEINGTWRTVKLEDA